MGALGVYQGLAAALPVAIIAYWLIEKPSLNWSRQVIAKTTGSAQNGELGIFKDGVGI